MPSDRSYGVAIALAGVCAVSPDAMLLRWMRSLGASSPDVAVAKYIGIIGFMLVLSIIRGVGGSFASPRHFLASAVCQLLYQLSFTFCLLLTDAATALLLISLAPLWAALLGVLFLQEPLPRRSIVALSLSVASVALVFVPRVAGVEAGAPDAVEVTLAVLPPNEQYSCAGALLALFTGFAQGASLTVNRHAAIHEPQAQLMLATAVSSLAATVVVRATSPPAHHPQSTTQPQPAPHRPTGAHDLPPTQPPAHPIRPPTRPTPHRRGQALYLPCYDSDDPHDFWACTPPVWRTGGFFALALCDALSVASFYTAMLVAPRYITGGEVALIMLLEDVLGPLWVFARFGEVPSPWVLAGGALLLGTLAWHEWAASVARGRAQQTQELLEDAEADDRPYQRVGAAKS